MMYSCGPKTIYEQKENIPIPWNYGDKITFDYDIQDTTKAYNLILEISHKIDFSYENIYLNVTTIFPGGEVIKNPVSFQLSDSQTEWIGDCNGDNCVVKIDMSSKAYYKKTGKYQLIFEQHSRKENIEGINSLEVKIQENEE